MRSLLLRADPGDDRAAAQLIASVDRALAGVDLDYYEPDYYSPYDYCEHDDGVQALDDALDEFERHLDSGSNAAVRKALEHLLVELGALAQSAENADALIPVTERACALFGRAAGGHPDPVSLAKWVVHFRHATDGWPPLRLDAVSHAFDDAAWDAYRTDLDALGAGGPYADPFRNEVMRMRLELADADGDVDLAIALLAASDEPHFPEIVTRLLASGRLADALSWLDRAVANRRVDFPWRSGRAVVPVDVACSAYLDGGRPDAALDVIRAIFLRDESVEAYRLLREVAERSGRLDAERAWAIGQATDRARVHGGQHLVRLNLADADVARAWEAADAFGAGGAWRELADASVDEFPLRAGELCFEQALEWLVTPNSKVYPAVADLIVRARSLYDKAGRRSEVDARIVGLRETYRRRPALRSALDAAGLPR